MASLRDTYTDDDYIEDAAPIINAALAESKALYFDPPPDGKKYPIYSPIKVVQNGQKLRGEGTFASMVEAKTAAARMVQINPGLNGVEITGLHMQRAVPAVAGGEGIRALGGLSNCLIEGNHIENQWHGLVLLSGDTCAVNRNVVIGSYSHSVLGTNTTFSWHWKFGNNLISRGDGDGIFFIASAVAGAPAACSFAAMEGNEVFSLTGHAIRIVGSPATKCTSVSIRGGFLGSTAASAILLDTHEGYHTIDMVKIEQVGIDTTGRDWSTPASGVGSAIELTANNGDVSILGGHIQTVAHNGISSRASRLNVNAPTILNCGISMVPNYRNGVAAYAGEANVIGLRSGNTPGGSSQAHAMWTHSAAALTHFGCATENNAISPIFSAAA